MFPDFFEAFFQVGMLECEVVVPVQVSRNKSGSGLK
jgi:hypothetical protein